MVQRPVSRPSFHQPIASTAQQWISGRMALAQAASWAVPAVPPGRSAIKEQADPPSFADSRLAWLTSAQHLHRPASTVEEQVFDGSLSPLTSISFGQSPHPHRRRNWMPVAEQILSPRVPPLFEQPARVWGPGLKNLHLGPLPSLGDAAFRLVAGSP